MWNDPLFLQDVISVGSDTSLSHDDPMWRPCSETRDRPHVFVRDGLLRRSGMC